MWDERYATADYAYGVDPNDFLVAQHHQLPKTGRLLCLAEGEGRNAVWLARQGYEVTALDASAVGLEKARKLAAQQGVAISTIHTDLTAYRIETESWDGIISIFAHLPPDLRHRVHRQCVTGLRPGGVMLLEAYTPKQLEYKTGGPPVAEMMMDSDMLQRELAGLDFQLIEETVRDIHEGRFHDGPGAVVQVVARSPVKQD